MQVPGSKSITARALFLAAAAHGTTVLRRPLLSDDTDGFAEGLSALGYRVEREPEAWTIEGRPEGPAVAEAEVFCRDGATTPSRYGRTASRVAGSPSTPASPRSSSPRCCSSARSPANGCGSP
jgi:5-enolpyruvylshikimate-3-phosphate synthase